MYKSMFRPEVIRRVELCFFRPCKTYILASDVRNSPRGYLCWTFNFCLYKPCAMCLSLLRFQPCVGSEPDCNCCYLSNKYTYMQLRSPEVTRVNFHLSLMALSKAHWCGKHLQLHLLLALNVQTNWEWLYSHSNTQEPSRRQVLIIRTAKYRLTLPLNESWHLERWRFDDSVMSWMPPVSTKRTCLSWTTQASVSRAWETK